MALRAVVVAAVGYNTRKLVVISSNGDVDERVLLVADAVLKGILNQHDKQ